jgi:hypothetical protein
MRSRIQRRSYRDAAGLRRKTAAQVHLPDDRGLVQSTFGRTGPQRNRQNRYFGRIEIYLAIPQEPPSTTPEERFATVAGTFRKLGLRLEAGNAPDDFVVIEHVERPSLN